MRFNICIIFIKFIILYDNIYLFLDFKKYQIIIILYIFFIFKKKDIEVYFHFFYYYLELLCYLLFKF